eukprot:8194816-Pyramimonas_sp.AAC.1
MCIRDRDVGASHHLRRSTLKACAGGKSRAAASRRGEATQKTSLGPAASKLPRRACRGQTCSAFRGQ